jgi:hypothetical protein
MSKLKPGGLAQCGPATVRIQCVFTPCGGGTVPVFVRAHDVRRVPVTDGLGVEHFKAHENPLAYEDLPARELIPL